MYTRSSALFSAALCPLLCRDSGEGGQEMLPALLSPVPPQNSGGKGARRVLSTRLFSRKVPDKGDLTFLMTQFGFELLPW